MVLSFGRAWLRPACGAISSSGFNGMAERYPLKASYCVVLDETLAAGEPPVDGGAFNVAKLLCTTVT